MQFFTTLALLAGTALFAVPDTAAAKLATGPAVAPPTVDADGPLLVRRGRGADDPAGHDAGDDRGRRGKNGGKGRGRGADDGPGHTWQDEEAPIELARQGRGRGRGGDDSAGGQHRGRGADDPPGHDAGDDHGRRGRDGGRGRGRGADDPPGHTFLLPAEAVALVHLAPTPIGGRG